MPVQFQILELQTCAPFLPRSDAILQVFNLLELNAARTP
jgi:hypothetical protein